jgi:predicted AlkP superfamily pyrophosphatase or phosphodiesterase
MKALKLFIGLLIVVFSSCVQHSTSVHRPKLVVGLVIDQMRWDYLYRYYDLYGNDGFKRLLRDGFSCENTMINYLPTYTAPGHACIYTGSVPAIHGIAGNDWIDNMSGSYMYCVSDSTVHYVGEGDTTERAMSPRNLLTTTITDELRLATNMESRVYGIAIKDRSCILPAGHLANGAYWMDDSTGGFRSSSYYPNPRPEWLKNFNKRHVSDSLMKTNWSLLLPKEKYKNSLGDECKYERCFKCEKNPTFPHIMDSLGGKNKYGAIKAMPAGNTLTFSMSKACIEGENLGSKGTTDFLCVSLSSTDYAGHQFGPNSIEVEDMYLRLDLEIAEFLKYLDVKVGRGNYLFFLTADHGAAHNSQYMIDEDVPAGFFQYKELLAALNEHLKVSFGKDSLVKDYTNYQLFLDEQKISAGKLDREKIKTAISDFLNKRQDVAYVIDMEHMSNAVLPEPIKAMVVNGYNKNRSGVIQIILNPAWYECGSSTTGTTHGSWNPYDAHIPLLWYGWGVQKGKTNNQLNMTDISPTIAAMLHIQMPNGCVGKPILEMLNK